MSKGHDYAQIFESSGFAIDKCIRCQKVKQSKQIMQFKILRFYNQFIRYSKPMKFFLITISSLLLALCYGLYNENEKQQPTQEQFRIEFDDRYGPSAA